MNYILSVNLDIGKCYLFFKYNILVYKTLKFFLKL